MTEIAFILDRSGSMSRLCETAIAGFNQFLREQKEVGTAARFTLVLFDDQYEVPFQATPISEVTELTAETFVPRGTTALLDAIGQTIDQLGARFAATPESEHPQQVVVAILTDGLENASRHFTQREISDKISHQQNKYSWQFFFLAANQDAIATAANLSIARKDAATYAADVGGVYASNRSVSRKLSALRKSSARAPLSREEKADLVAPISEIAEEEDRKRRE